MVGMRPCGLIILLAELFSAESISQIYANLHEHLRSNSNVASNLRKQ